MATYKEIDTSAALDGRRLTIKKKAAAFFVLRCFTIPTFVFSVPTGVIKAVLPR